MGHNHHNHSNDYSSSRSLLFVTFLNVFITVVEIIGGLMANSLALLSDALHNLSDTIAILLAYIARKVSRRYSNEKKTFGYKRIEILAAFFNALVLIGISVFLVYEGVNRFYNPEPIKGLLMMVVASAGLVFNLIAVLILKKHSGSSLNIRSAYLHLMGDTLSSFAVIIGGVLIYFFDVYWVDPVITILISIYIIKETWDVFQQSTNILMQAVPPGIDLQEIITDLEKISGIGNIHHVHIWGLSDQEFHFECHADLAKDLSVSETSDVREEMEQILGEKYHIGHLTVQFEFNVFDNKNIINGS